MKITNFEKKKMIQLTIEYESHLNRINCHTYSIPKKYHQFFHKRLNYNYHYQKAGKRV